MQSFIYLAKLYKLSIALRQAKHSIIYISLSIAYCLVEHY